MNKNDYGLYRDNGLLALRYVNGKIMDHIIENFIQLFKDIDFLTDIETNVNILDFFDRTFSLNNGTYKPYKNHPPQIIKMLTKIISDRLLKNPSNKEVFIESKRE